MKVYREIRENNYFLPNLDIRSKAPIQNLSNKNLANMIVR